MININLLNILQVNALIVKVETGHLYNIVQNSNW